MLSLLESIRNNLINVNSAIQLRLIWGYVSQSGIKLRIFTKQLIIEKDAISYGNRDKRGKILRPTIYWYFFHSIPTLSAVTSFYKMWDDCSKLVLQFLIRHSVSRWRLSTAKCRSCTHSSFFYFQSVREAYSHVFTYCLKFFRSSVNLFYLLFKVKFGEVGLSDESYGSG